MVAPSGRIAYDAHHLELQADRPILVLAREILTFAKE
jgi:hypothetical protein